MPSTVVLTSTTFKIENNVTFGKHKPNANGGYDIELTIGDGVDDIVLQTPKMRSPFGLSTDKTNPFKKSLDISFQGIETNDSIKSFRTLVETMDDTAIDYAVKNSEAFFKKKLSREVIAEYYCSGIKKSKKEQYADTFKFKLPFWRPNPEKNLPDGKFNVLFWDSKQKAQNSAYLDKGDCVSAIIKPKSIWVGNRGFGIIWNCSQVMIYKQNKNSKFAFVKTEESETEEELSESEEEVEVEVDA